MQASELPAVESQLLAYVRQLERNYYDWRATHLHLSCLKPHNRGGNCHPAPYCVIPLRRGGGRFSGIVLMLCPALYRSVPPSWVANQVASDPKRGRPRKSGPRTESGRLSRAARRIAERTAKNAAARGAAAELERFHFR